jgi:CubicO group peptidase (beta-lactamase class C family)
VRREEIPPEAWQVGPWNRWAYVHVSEVVPTVPVARGEAAALALDEAAIDADALFADAYADGLAIIRDGTLIHERYSGEMHAGSLHLSQSVGKSVMGLTIAALAVDPNALVTEYVPEVHGSGYEGATVRHLLDMTAAIDFVEDYDAFVRYDAACAWHPALPEIGPETVLEYLPTVGPAPDWRHGERFHYATPNTDLLGIAVERAGGAPLATLIARELWGPLGAERDAALTVDHAGTATIGGGFCATLRDYARLGLLVCEGGGGIVPAGWIAGLGTGDPRAFAQATAIELRSGADGYHDQWWHRDGGVMARGIHGQLIAVHRDERVVVVVLSSWPEATDAEREDAQRTLVARVRDRLTA